MLTIKEGQVLQCINEIPGVTGHGGITMETKFTIEEVKDNYISVVSTMGKGVFSEKELISFFKNEKVDTTVKQYVESVFGQEVTLYINKEKKTTVAKLGNITAKSKCIEYDEYNEEIGINIALAKLNLKLLANEGREIKENLELELNKVQPICF